MQYEVKLIVLGLNFENYIVKGALDARFLANFFEHEYPGCKIEIETLKKTSWHKEL